MVREQKMAFGLGVGKEYGHKVDETRKRIEAEKRESLTVTKIVPNEDLKELYVRMAEDIRQENCGRWTWYQLDLSSVRYSGGFPNRTFNCWIGQVRLNLARNPSR